MLETENGRATTEIIMGHYRKPFFAAKRKPVKINSKLLVSMKKSVREAK